MVDPSGAARFPGRNRFSVLESTVRDTECLMSTVVDGSSGNVEVFPMTDDAAGHTTVHSRSAAVHPLVDHGVSGVNRRPLRDTESPMVSGKSAVWMRQRVEFEPDPPFRVPGVATLRAAFLLLDQVNLADEMKERASVKSVPKFLRGLQ